MGNKLSLGKLLTFSLLVVAVPFSFSQNKQEAVIEKPVKAESSGSVLTPLSKQQIMNLQEGYHGNFLMCLLDGDSLGLLTFDTYGYFRIKEVNYSEGYTIDIHEFLRPAINGMLEMDIYQQEDYSTGDTYLAMNLASLEFCKNFHYTDQEYSITLSYSDYGYPIYFSEGTEGIHLNTYSNGTGEKVNQYFAYDKEDESTYETFYLSADKASDIFFYQLDDTFVEVNSWQKKFLAIDENSDPENLISMWQGLSFYDKRYILDSFWVDPEHPDSGKDYGTDGKEKEMNELLNKYSLYASLTSQITQTPYRCMDVDPNSVTIDYTHNVIRGLNGLDSFVLVDGNDTIYIEYNEKDTFSFNSPEYALLGNEFDLYYCVDSQEYTYSENPLHISFKSANPNIEILDTLPISEAVINVVDGQDVTVQEIYSTYFVLNIPEGFEFALLTTDCYENNLFPYMDDQQNEYYFIDSDVVEYISDSSKFEKAYNENFEEEYLEAEGTYYLVYRLSETDSTAPSYICGFFEITTAPEEASLIKELEVESYALYSEYQSLDRFQDAISYDKEHEQYFDSFFAETFDFLNSSSQQDIESYLEERSLENRYYYQASKVLLLSYGNQLLTDRSISEFGASYDNFVTNFAEGTFQISEIDEYVDNIINGIDNLLELYSLQEGAAQSISLYFNSVLGAQFTLNIPEEAWTLLSKYVQLIYEATSEEEIEQLVSEFYSSLDAIFTANGEDNNG